MPPGPSRPWIAPLGIVLVCGALYLNTLPAALVWDDLEFLSQPSSLREPGDLAAIFGSPYWGPSDYVYRPLTVWSLALNYRANLAVGLPGEHPFSFHFVNVLLHAAAGCMLYGFLRRLALAPWPALAAALLFAAHPIHTEAVAQIVGRSELLAGSFGLLFLTLHRRGPPLAAAVSFLLALWSKESAMAFLPLAIWTDVCFPGERRRFGWTGLALYALVLAGWIAMRAAAVGEGHEGVPFLDNPLAYASIAERLRTAAWIQLDYLRLQLWPAGLSADYSFQQIPLVTRWLDPRLLASVTAALAAGAAAWLLRGRQRVVTYALLGYAILFAPTGNFLLPIGTIMGERLAYSPSAMTAVLLAYTASLLRPRFGRWVAVALGLLLLSYGALTVARNRTWTGPEIFARTLVRSAPDSAKAHYTMAVVQFRSHAFDEAQASLERALAIHPHYAEAWSQRGRIHAELGDHDAAARAFREAVRIFPAYTEALYGLAHAEHQLDHLDQAAEGYRAVIRLDPGLVLAHTNLGVVLARQGRLAEAEQAWVRALELDPENPVARRNLAQLRGLAQP